MALKPTLTLAHSPDADDVVMWWPLGDVNLGRGAAIDTGKWLFQPVQIDIQEANERAIARGDLDVTAISAHAYPHVQDRYRITACGASMGRGMGRSWCAGAGARPAGWRVGRFGRERPGP